MRTGAIRRPLSRALIMYAAPGPAVSLRCTAGSIPARLRRSSLIRTTAVQRRRRVESKPFISSRRCRCILFGSVTERRRRVRIKPFIPPYPSGALIGNIRCIVARASPHPSVQRRRRGESRPFISSRRCRSILFGSVQRRRRGGLKPGVQRSGTPGNQGIKYSEPLARGGGDRPFTDTVHQTANHAPAGSP